MNAELLHKKTKTTKTTSIPSLFFDNEWIVSADMKTEVFAQAWKSKSELPPYPSVEPADFYDGCVPLLSQVHLRSRHALRTLQSLNVNKATGPDCLPARILREAAVAIFLPFIALCRRILNEQHWPQTWKTHHLIPLSNGIRFLIHAIIEAFT